MSELTDLYGKMAQCQDCALARQRTRVVPGEGPENARILFIGEAPGWHEDQQGRPFVGPAGQLLDSLLASAGLRRNQVYICNVIKCRPPGNRDPMPSEMEACRKWLDLQLQVIAPRMIVTLGRYSMARYFPGEAISKIHGTARKRDGIVTVAMYHPAAALHQQSLRKTIEADMKKLPQFMAEMDGLADEEQKTEQLRLL